MLEVMPTFTAIALDSLIEPGAEKSMVRTRNSPDPRLERRRSTSNYTESRGLDDTNLKLESGPSIPPISKLKLEKGGYLPPNGRLERGVSVPPSTNNVRGVSIPPNGKLEKGVSVPSHVKLANDAPTATATATTAVADNKNHWTQISPALYTTPESTPLPGSPSSFPPSPYIINHKRRGPRLMKSFSEEDVVTWKKESDEIKVDENEKTAETCSVSKNDIYIPSEVLDSTLDDTIKPFGSGDSTEKHMIGACSDDHGSSDVENGPAGQNGVERFVDFSFQPNVEVDDFISQQNSTNVKNIGDNEDNGGAEQSCNSTTPMAEFYDAWEELSSEGGPMTPLPDLESDLREMRLTLLMEIEKRKQAEENLNNLRSQWQRIRDQLSLVGLSLPTDPTTLREGEKPADPAAELCQQVYLARFVSNSIGRGVAKAEVEMEMEARINLKNFEITRLLDRLHYFEAVNQEMSQRNQEVVETARRHRQRRNRRHKWMLGSMAAAVTVGSAVLLYSYLRGGKGSSHRTVDRSPN